MIRLQLRNAPAPPPRGFAPRWLGWLGLVADTLLLLTLLTVTADILFRPFFFGAMLALVWLLATGLSLVLRTRGAASAVHAHGGHG
jgi:hypothetical protein